MIENIKYVLEENINTIKENLEIKKLKITFNNNRYSIYYNNNIINEGKLTDVKLDYISQKRFVISLIRKITVFAEYCEDLSDEYYDNLINIDNEIYFDILGYGDMVMNDPILVDIKEIDKYIEILEKYFNKDKLRVILHQEDDVAGFHIDGIIHETPLHICYMEGEEIQYKRELINYKMISDEEIDNAISIVF